MTADVRFITCNKNQNNPYFSLFVLYFFINWLFHLFWYFKKSYGMIHKNYCIIIVFLSKTHLLVISIPFLTFPLPYYSIENVRIKCFTINNRFLFIIYFILVCLPFIDQMTQKEEMFICSKSNLFIRLYQFRHRLLL